ncbi:hypothetical protein llap_2272 [Limosa lapponica baueri]|uniref:Uncharacterized protein n=1 Tax=Limosa lapponica baueri TaxID=1758121 RepID=A0A2I0UN21_LIMLA|nr:hypothetical protein llap_2272 [Limosa lapponica baueri]
MDRSVFCGSTEESEPFKKLQKINSDPHPAKVKPVLGPTSPNMPISSSPVQYCTTLEPGSLNMLETAEVQQNGGDNTS